MGIWPFNRTVEKSLAAPDEATFAILSGETYGPVNPLSDPTVVAAVTTISTAASTLDLHLVKRDDTSADVSHPALDLLRGHVNDWTSGSDLIRDLIAQALTHDVGGIAWVNKSADGRPLEILRYNAGRIACTYAGDGSGRPSYTVNGRSVPASDIIHIRGPFSRCPISLCYPTVSASIAMTRYIESLFRRMARPGGLVEVPSGAGEKAIQNMIAGWEAAYGGADSAGGTAFLFDGATFKQMALTTTDAQFVENKRALLEDIARAFNISSVMLGDLVKSSYSSAWQKYREFLSITLMPWLKALEDAFNRALLNDDERAKYTFKFDVDDLTRVDLEKRATAISSLVSSRVINPNEARTWLDAGLAPYDGGNEFANPNTGASQPGAPPPPKPEPDGDSNE
ncbi:MAG: phage portal protein [Xanthobacteraceae bacterium]|nr:phage portal protein [Xanthobacteraceae bacterium]